jgi:dynein heavy chain
MLMELHKVHSYYIYSLNAFVVVFQRAIEKVGGGGRKGGGSGMLSRLKKAAQRVIVSQRFHWNTDMLLAARMPDEGDRVNHLDLAAMLTGGLDELIVHDADTTGLDDAVLAERCGLLLDSVTTVVFNFVRRGLFECDKLTVATMLSLQVLQESGKLHSAQVRFLVSGDSGESGESGDEDSAVTMASMVSNGEDQMGEYVSQWMPHSVWPKVVLLQGLLAPQSASSSSLASGGGGGKDKEPKTTKATAKTMVRVFAGFPEALENYSDEWQEWFDHEHPETAELPGDHSEIDQVE